MKKILSILLAICLLFGCSLNNNPSSKVKNYLNNYKNLSDEVLEDMESKIASENLSNENKDTYRDILKRQYKSLRYEIKDESINGNDAIVTAKITVYDLMNVINESNSYLEDHIEEFNDSNNIYQENIFNTYQLKEMSKVNNTVDYEIDFFLKKTNGEWVLDNPDTLTIEKINGLYNYENY